MCKKSTFVCYKMVNCLPKIDVVIWWNARRWHYNDSQGREYMHMLSSHRPDWRMLFFASLLWILKNTIFYSIMGIYAVLTLTNTTF